jgi:type IV secretion system protein VirB8
VSSDKSLVAYFDEAATWDADRAAQAARSCRIAWCVAAAAVCAALAASAAVMFLAPLKRVEPFLIRVDGTTGLVDVVPVYAGTAKLPETVTRYLLTHYVEVCEQFYWSTAEQDYEECGAFNSAERNQQWSAQWALSNPSSPLNLHKDGSEVGVHVVSISFFERANGVTDLAQVRYTRSAQTGNDAGEHVTHWIANIQFTYTNPSTDVVTRQWNPLGLRILEFRTEQEVPGSSPPAPSAATPVRAGGAS